MIFEVPDGELRPSYTFTLDPPPGATLAGTTPAGAAVYERDDRRFTLFKNGETIMRRDYIGPLVPPEGGEKATVSIPDGDAPTVTGNRDPNPLAGLDFASDETAERAANASPEALAALRAMEPSGKGGYTAKDLTKAEKAANRTEET